MMQAGKDYLDKGDDEWGANSPRAIYLRELLKAIRTQKAPAEIDEVAKPEAEPIKSTNQNKPTLKLSK